MAQNLRQRDLENDNYASTEALSESRASLSEWQTDPELKFYGRAMSSATSKRLAGQRLLHHTAGVLFVVVVLVGLAPLNRPMIAASIPLVIQHWFVLLRYRNSLLYGIVMAGCGRLPAS